MTPAAQRKEYLRRNLLHASSVGMTANAQSVLDRLSTHKRKPAWLVDALRGIVERGRKVCPEMAAHRNEIKGGDVE